MHRLYCSVKLAPHRPTEEEKKGEKFSPFSGHHATAEAIAHMIGVSYRTVQNAHRFGKVVETLQEISPQAAERVLRGEVRDALTELPKVASANFQCHPTTWAVAFAFLVAPNNGHCSRPKTLTDRNKRRALQALNNNCWNLLSPSRAQSPYLPKQPHSFCAFATNFFQMFQLCTKEGQFAPFLYQPLPTLVVPSGFEFVSFDCTLNSYPCAIEPSRQLVCCQSHKGHLGRIHNILNNAIQRLQPQHFWSPCETLAFACVFAIRCQNGVDLLR
jgi:hypothetical protein